jgi:hypothetical protein
MYFIYFSLHEVHVDILPCYAEQQCKDDTEKNDQLENSLEDCEIRAPHLFLCLLIRRLPVRAENCFPLQGPAICMHT